MAVLSAVIAGLCVASTPEVSPASAQPAAAVAVPDGAQSFDRWLADYRARAAARGVSPRTLAAMLDGLRYNPRVVELDRAQPDDSRPTAAPPSFRSDVERRMRDRVAPGRARIAKLSGALAGIEERYGVPREILVAIWGMETSFGGFTGSFNVPEALASLAFEGRRRELFTGELDAALTIVERGLATPAEMTGSWAGAMGQPQFLPSSYLRHAVDGDGDGHADIWRSEADTLASIANYLANNGWRRGLGWGMQVIVPAALDRTRLRELTVAPSCPRVFARHSRWIPVEEWRQLGLIPVNSLRGWPPDGTLATLIEPDGPGTGGYLTYGNYRAILKYNCSNFYALSVGLLADRLR